MGLLRLSGEFNHVVKADPICCRFHGTSPATPLGAYRSKIGVIIDEGMALTLSPAAARSIKSKDAGERLRFPGVPTVDACTQFRLDAVELGCPPARIDATGSD